jgi:hypothetical protein
MASDEEPRSDQDTHDLQLWSSGKMTRRRALGFFAGEALGAALLLGFGIPKPEAHNVEPTQTETEATESDITETEATESDTTEYTATGEGGSNNNGCGGDCSPVPPSGGSNLTSSPPTKVLATTRIDTRLL